MSSRTQRSGTVTFAAVLFTVAGFFHGIEGLQAIFKKEYFVEEGLLYENAQFWGWLLLVLGIAQISAAYLILGRATSGRTLGIIVAAAAAILSFLTLGAHPVGAIVVIAINVIIIHALTVHGDMFVPGGIEEGPMAPRPEPSGRPYV
ncbi:MAG TPA: hypothetical protein VIC58_12825 [Actinomycetota bacterium]|jgi:hypothetical protein